ncbi:hypothetical protein Tco_1020661, partial [Tanacetum coccineum]
LCLSLNLPLSGICDPLSVAAMGVGVVWIMRCSLSSPVSRMESGQVLLPDPLQALPSEKVVASGKNGDDGDLLLFRDGPGTYDISARALGLFISWECSRPVAGVKVNPSSGTLLESD